MMKNIVPAVAGMLLAGAVQASPVSCEDLIDMADVLDEVAEGFVVAMDNIIDAMDRLYYRDCE